MLRSYYPRVTERDIRRQLGSGFSEVVMELEPERWHGPVLSGYGTHLVYIHDRREAEPPTFAEVEEQVRQDWESEKREQLNEQFITSLMARYDVTIEDVPVKAMPVVLKEQSQ